MSIFQRINNNLIFSILQVNYDRKFKSNQTESCFITKLLNIIIRGMINYKLVTLVKMQPPNYQNVICSDVQNVY